jgi:hypothetical protein
MFNRVVKENYGFMAVEPLKDFDKNNLINRSGRAHLPRKVVALNFVKRLRIENLIKPKN